MPNFGDFKKQLEIIKADYYKKASSEEPLKQRSLVVLNKEKVRKLKDVIGKSLNSIGSYNQLNNQEQVVALIDEVIE